MDEIKKIEVTPDWLYQYLQEHNFIISLLSKRMGVSNGIVCNSFRHVLNRLGKPMKFSDANIARLNAALPKMADEIKAATISFGSNETFTNTFGHTYDPATREAVLAVGEFFKLTPFLERLLGWKKGKRDMILVSTKSPVYGQVSQDDVNRINAELLAVAGVLSNYEVVDDDNSSNSNENDDNNAKHLKASTKRKTMECRCEAPKYGWDDTSIGLPERSRLLRQQWPNGMLLFRVNGGYTVEVDDAHTVHKLMPDVQPYTNPESGITTAYMSEEQMTQVLSKIIAKGRRVMITDMYKE